MLLQAVGSTQVPAGGAAILEHPASVITVLLFGCLLILGLGNLVIYPAQVLCALPGLRALPFEARSTKFLSDGSGTAQKLFMSQDQLV